ncbi:UNVERIFIED_CONTAM: Photosystem I reaction center subunit XI, chloroplastic [Sesamum radiatum]|uniref:PSI subunit V n=1 Tax=Sesamum radiatum TaxID=300843 RepID=A0AAW2USC4_SESRA
MAAAASTMASHLKTNFSSSFTRALATPRGISGAPFRVLPSTSRRTSSFTIKAVQSDKDGRQPSSPGGGGGAGTWVPPRRPFVKAGPSGTPLCSGAGSLAAGGLVVILSICLTIYGIASFKEGEPSTAPSLTLTGRKKQPDQLQTADGWAKFTGGFFFGGISGVVWAYFLLYVLDLPYYVK